ncbi:MAG: STAS domain-containing protein [Verrucomicrobiota bacterium]|nr:STAS domain-containing protein [Verrucomicrobiota bacterium]
MSKGNYQVHDTPERSFVKISDKATFLNCSPLREFFLNRLESGQINFVLDFEDCRSLDSTFLGILVSLAIKVKSSGSLTLLNLKDRNLETVKNLGIHKIAVVSEEHFENLEKLDQIYSKETNKQASAEVIYQAHRSLMNLNSKNQRLFCDVIKFMDQKRENSP